MFRDNFLLDTWEVISDCIYTVVSFLHTHTNVPIYNYIYICTDIVNCYQTLSLSHNLERVICQTKKEKENDDYLSVI